MGDSDKDPVEASFEERLSRAQKKAEAAPSFENADEQAASPMGIAFKMGIELVVGSGVGAFIGFWFDKWFGTAPWFMIVLLILGFASGIRNVVREAQKMQNEQNAEDANKD